MLSLSSCKNVEKRFHISRLLSPMARFVSVIKVMKFQHVPLFNRIHVSFEGAKMFLYLCLPIIIVHLTEPSSGYFKNQILAKSLHLSHYS